jgi:hypothetical protein
MAIAAVGISFLLLARTFVDRAKKMARNVGNKQVKVQPIVKDEKDENNWVLLSEKDSATS